VYSVRIIGRGRAGLSLWRALTLSGWPVEIVAGRAGDLADAAEGVDVVVIATPDGTVAEIARSIRPVPSTTLAHLSGSQGLDALLPHPRRAAVHPLVPLPTPEIGADRLRAGATFAVAGDPVAWAMVDALGGRAVEVADQDRARYHAAACIAANHVVALLGQVERVAGEVGLGLDAFLGLARAAVEDVERLGPERALTGPAARGDWATLDGHLNALPPAERDTYSAGVSLALRLAAHRDPVASVPH